MRLIILLCIVLFSCTNADKSSTTSVSTADTSTSIPARPVETSDPASQPISEPSPQTPTTDTVKVVEPLKVYGNKRFRNVTVSKLADDNYRIKGEGQIFEASFGWVVEDGHNELKKGFAMTDAGAPEWGKFDFTVSVKKERPNSVLHLIIFETSAKDGSRQYELPIALK